MSCAFGCTGQKKRRVYMELKNRKFRKICAAAVSAVITAVSLFTAVKVEKLKKANDLTTYKEIKAYMEGKSLDEISAERIKKGSKNLMKALFGAVSAMIGFTVCILMAWLLK